MAVIDTAVEVGIWGEALCRNPAVHLAARLDGGSARGQRHVALVGVHNGRKVLELLSAQNHGFRMGRSEGGRWRRRKPG